MRRRLSAACACAVLAMLVLAGCGAEKAPARRVLWSTSFDGPAGSAPDPKDWSYQVGAGGWGNTELQCYTDRRANSALDGHGHLVITARREPGRRCSDGHVTDYTSGRVTSVGKHTLRYGRLAVRAKVPAGLGGWSSFWAVGADQEKVGWPESGEIDVFEHVGRADTTVTGSLHGPMSTGAVWGITNLYSANDPLSDGFHVYAVEWTPTKFTWYVDQDVYAVTTRSQVEEKGRWVFDKPFYVRLNLAVGGYGGTPGPRWPQRYVVDWVRLYAPS